MTYGDWCNLNNCTHAHCPYECQKPQPFILDDKLYCGKHWFDDKVLVEMVPCRPEICD